MILTRLAGLLRESRGMAALEFAFILPVFMMLVFGIIEMGSAWYAKQTLVNATREGARLGAMHNSEGITDDDVVALVSRVLSSAEYSSPFQVESTGATEDSGALVTVQVNSEYQLPVLGSMLPNVNSTITLTATTVMRHE